MNRDDLHARLSLDMDPKERANLRAQHEQWEAKRRTAIQYGDQGSPVPGSDCECGPLSFAPLHCTGCSVLLTRQNHGNGRQCQRCFEETQALALRYEQARQDYLAARKPGPIRRFLSWVGLVGK
jgi:hypothetical protein